MNTSGDLHTDIRERVQANPEFMVVWNRLPAAEVWSLNSDAVLN